MADSDLSNPVMRVQGFLRRLYNDAAPMLIKELRGYFRSKKFLITLTLLLLVYAVIFFITVFSTYLSQKTVDLARVGTAGFGALTICNFVIVFFILPAFGATAIIREKKEQTMDVLLTTIITPAQIVWGKFMTILSYAFVFFAATFPLVVISYLLGGVTIWNIIFEYACLAIASIMLIMMSICISATTPNLISAIVGTYILSGLLSAGAFSAIFEIFRFSRSVAFDTDVLEELTRSFITFFDGFIVPLLGYSIVFAYFFIMAVNTLKSFSDNRTTALKKLYLFMVICFVAVFMVNAIYFGREYVSYTYQYRFVFDLYFSYLVSCAIITTFFSYFFITKETLLPQKLHFRVEEIRRRSFVQFLFQPGIIANVHFCIGVHLVMVAALILLPVSGIFMGSNNVDTFVMTLCITLLAPVFFISTYLFFTLLLDGFILRRILAGLLALVIMLGPLIFAEIFPAFSTSGRGWEGHANPVTMYFLSPVCNYIAAYSTAFGWSSGGFYQDSIGGINIFALFVLVYLPAAAILLGWNLKKAQKLINDYDQYLRHQLSEQA